MIPILRERSSETHLHPIKCSQNLEPLGFTDVKKITVDLSHLTFCSQGQTVVLRSTSTTSEYIDTRDAYQKPSLYSDRHIYLQRTLNFIRYIMCVKNVGIGDIDGPSLYVISTSLRDL